jgi:hypothetical protein
MRIALIAAAMLVARPIVAQTAAAHSHIVATLSDSTFWPEGVDADSATGRLYVTSVRHRTIAEIEPNGSSREVLVRDGAGVGPIFGVRFDARRGVLWATTSGYKQIAGSNTVSAALLEIRPADGAILRRWTVPRDGADHFFGDLAIGPGGDVYVSDSVQPLLYILRPGADTLESIRSPLFRSLQGLAPSPDGRSLYLTDYSNGLLRVSLESRDVGRIPDLPGSTSRGCDGIVWYHGSIIAVQNGTRTRRIIRFVLAPSGSSLVSADVLDENTAIADEPTIGTILRGQFVYVANSQWDKHDDTGARIPGRTITAPVLLGFPLP